MKRFININYELREGWNCFFIYSLNITILNNFLIIINLIIKKK